MPITALPTPAPSTSDPSTFDARADALFGALPTFVTEANALEANVNAKEVAINAVSTAMASANFKGAWSSLTGAAAVPYSVSHLGRYWMLLSNLANVAAKTPGTDSEWQEIGNVTIQDFQAAVNPRAMSQGVAMTAAASGSSGITVADNDNIDMGTGNFAPYFCGIIPDVTPATNIILAQKHDGTNGWILTLLTTGYLRTTINAATYDSTATLASVGVVDGENVKILSGITRETASVAGSVQHYVNGLALGTSVAITAGAPTTVTNAVSLYVLGTSAVRTAGVANTFALFNRCPTAAEVLDLYRNGIAEADKWGSKTPIYTSDFSAGADGWTAFNGTASGNEDGVTDGVTSKDNCLKYYADATSTNNHYISKTIAGASEESKYLKFKFWYYIPSGQTNVVRIDIGNTITMGPFTVVGTWTYVEAEAIMTSTSLVPRFTARNAAGTVFVGANSADDDRFYITGLTVLSLGCSLALEPEGIQPSPGQWIDSSSNKLHAQLPAKGATLTRMKKDFEFRATNTWTASSAAQYLTGFNQVVQTADHFITSITTQATVTTGVENLELGDGSDADRFVAAFAPSATRTKQTIAAQNDGTNLKLVYTPAAEATMTVETIIRGFIWEP